MSSSDRGPQEDIYCGPIFFPERGYPADGTQIIFKNTLETDKDIEEENEYECNHTADDNVIVEEIITLYHNLCPDLPPCQILSPATRHAILSRWNEHSDLELFRQMFAAAQRSNLLTDKQVNWRASLDWLMDCNHFARVYNSCYDNTSAQKQPISLGSSEVLGEAELEAIAKILNEPGEIT